MTSYAQRLHFREQGKGDSIILIHGFPLSGELWEDDFVRVLSSEFNVITIDLPGFGKSPLPPYQFTIDEIAARIVEWLTWKKLEKTILIGHSLGGYVALAMVAQQPEIFAGFGLFHSTALADSEEKKQSRNKIIEFVEKNGAPAFTTNFIPQLFANKEHPAIEKVKRVAASATAQAVIGYTQAMRNRLDRTSTLQSFKKPILFITGEIDPGIPVNSIHQQVKLAMLPTLHVLDDQAHMSMLEAPAVTASYVRDFARIGFKKGVK